MDLLVPSPNRPLVTSNDLECFFPQYNMAWRTKTIWQLALKLHYLHSRFLFYVCESYVVQTLSKNDAPLRVERTSVAVGGGAKPEEEEDLGSITKSRPRCPPATNGLFSFTPLGLFLVGGRKKERQIDPFSLQLKATLRPTTV